MILNVFDRVFSLPLVAHAAFAGATVAGFQWIKGRLDASYAASGHPVDYVTGQTTFSGQTLKGYYAHMQDAGTLDVYRTTQIIDYGFIVTMACMAIFVCTLVARLGRENSWARRLGVLAGGAVLLGAVCDAIENGWSFVMLANPTGFADWLALPYSGFASVKFALITIGLALLCTSLLAGLLGRVLQRPKVG